LSKFRQLSKTYQFIEIDSKLAENSAALLLQLNAGHLFLSLLFGHGLELIFYLRCVVEAVVVVSEENIVVVFLLELLEA
jgi:hypothetical protein